MTLRSLSLALACVSLALPLAAQEFRGSILGQLIDPQGAAVAPSIFDDPGVDVSNPAQFGVITDASGKRAFRFGGKVRF
jgi:hypothetical protein